MIAPKSKRFVSAVIFLLYAFGAPSLHLLPGGSLLQMFSFHPETLAFDKHVLESSGTTKTPTSLCISECTRHFGCTNSLDLP